jgi:hypothetical protein
MKSNAALLKHLLISTRSSPGESGVSPAPSRRPVGGQTTRPLCSVKVIIPFVEAEESEQDGARVSHPTRRPASPPAHEPHSKAA